MFNPKEARERINPPLISVTHCSRRYIDEYRGEKAFPSILDAMDYIIDGSGVLQIIREPIGELKGLSAKLIRDSHHPGDIVAVTISGNPTKTITVPRSVKVAYTPGEGYISSPGICVTTHGDIVDQMNIQVGDYYGDPHLERGQAWVMLDDPQKPFLKFVLLPKSPGEQYSPEEIMSVMRRTHRAVIGTFQDIQSGIFPE